MEKSKMYLAGPWFSDRMEKVMNYLQDTDVIFDDHKYIIYFPIQHNFPTPKETFLSNIKAIDNCQLMIACISEKDTGTAFEIGYAKHKGIPVYLLVNEEKDMNSKTNIMLAYAADGVITLNDFANVLVKGIESVETLQFVNTWENKE